MIGEILSPSILQAAVQFGDLAEGMTRPSFVVPGKDQEIRVVKSHRRL